MNYNQKYNKEHYSSFKVELKKEEYAKLQKKLNSLGISKAEFLRQAIKRLYDDKRKTNISKKA